MKKLCSAFIIPALICFTVLPGCLESAGSADENVASEESLGESGETGQEGAVEGPEEALQEETGPENGDGNEDYSIFIDDYSLALFQWIDELELEAFLGEPLDRKTIQLDATADTFAGSHVRQLYYEGLALTLFSPAHDGRTFWLYEVEVKAGGYATARGIGVGNTLAELQEAYPDLVMVETGQREAALYRIEDFDRPYTYLEFIVSEGRVEKILLRHEHP